MRQEAIKNRQEPNLNTLLNLFELKNEKEENTVKTFCAITETGKTKEVIQIQTK